MLFHNSKFAFVVFAFLSMAISPVSQAYTPKSPEVQAMVEDGLAYIEQNFGKHNLDQELGGYAVCAIAAYSHTGDENHPLVKTAIEKIRDGVKNGFPNDSHANYSLGLALVLLGTLDAHSYPHEVLAILDEIYERQLASGTWTYPNEQVGDTSQSQYACLGMWMAHRQGFPVKMPNVANATNWFLRTQAPDGGFGYRPNDPGSFVRVEQDRKTPSMGVAGAASLYVTGELLGFIHCPEEMRARKILPPAITPATTGRTEVVATGVDSTRWQHAVGSADEWCRKNASIENPFHQYYYMYTVERYWAFRELAIDRPEKEPWWYNNGVQYLQRTVHPNGSWKSDNGPTIGTAFAVLFLLRNSKATVERIEGGFGILAGGSSLPADLANLTTDSKRCIVGLDYVKSLDDYLKLLGSPATHQHDDYPILPERFVLSEDQQTRSQQITSLSQMVTDGPFHARLTAAKTLGTIRDFASVPALIFALSDPDWRVAQAARDALRFISRNESGFGLEIESEAPTKAQWTKAQQQWTAWLLSVKPNAELIE